MSQNQETVRETLPIPDITSTVDMRQVINGILYTLRSGCPGG
ncbi:MAG: hypothetical protein ACE1ZZ_03220 [Dehalococcoidia bacterium]